MEPGTRAADREMSAFDTWLYRGDRNPRTRSMLVSVCRLDAAPDERDWLRALDRTSRLIPRLRQRVVDPPLSLLLPAWVVDPDFELTAHVRRVRLPAPGTPSQLLDFVGREALRRLDETRPLWEATLVEGLERNEAAVVLKVSHALADAEGALRLFAALCGEHVRGAAQADASTAVDAEAPDDDPPPPIPEDLTPDERLFEALRRSPHEALAFGLATGRRALAAARATLADPKGMVATVARVLDAGRALGGGARPSPLLRGRSCARRCLAFDVSVAALEAAGVAAGGSQEDVSLAGLVGALRAYHVALGVEVEELPLAMPSSLRPGSEATPGNQFGVAILAAPLAVEDPAERIARIRDLVIEARSNPAAAAPAWSTPVLARLPDAVRDVLVERVPVPDFHASSITGSPQALWFAGRRVLSQHAFGPVPGIAAMVTLQSYAGHCHVGMTFDPAAIRHPAAFAQALAQSYGEVLALGGGAAITLPAFGRAGRAQACA